MLSHVLYADFLRNNVYPYSYNPNFTNRGFDKLGPTTTVLDFGITWPKSRDHKLDFRDNYGDMTVQSDTRFRW
jgi:hypothetical protein